MGVWYVALQHTTDVVYFDQQMHACACIGMVENNENHSKMMKKVPFPSCAREAHKRLTELMWQVLRIATDHHDKLI